MIWEIILFLAFLVAWDIWKRSHMTMTLKNVPAVSRIPLVGTALASLSLSPDNLVEMFHYYVQRYGKSFYGIMLHNLVFITAEHRFVDAILSSPAHLQKFQLYRMLTMWLGNGLLLSDGKLWQTMRKIITPTFHFKILEQFVLVFDRQSEVFIEKLQPMADGRTVVNVFKPVGLLAMDIIAETAMGVSINAQMETKSEFVQAVKEVTAILGRRFVRPPYIPLPSFKLFGYKLYRRQVEGIQVMHAFTERIISERRQMLEQELRNGSIKEDLISSEHGVGSKKRLAFLDVLLQATMEDGQPLTDKQIRDEVNTFMFEGHDTTTSAISFCLYALSRHSQVQQHLFQEIRQHFGDDLSRPILYADLQELPYLNCVIKESLRLYPSVPAIGRYLSSELKLDDCTIPAQSNVIILLYEMLRDPDVFDDPLAFKPERHLNPSGKASAYCNIPFSAGPRNCIGQRFALYEMRTVIAKVLRHYELLPLGEEVQLAVTIILRSKNGTQMGLRPRRYD